MSFAKTCIVGLDKVPPAARGCVLSIGNFDGVHLGHQRIIETARTLADTHAKPVAVMTFEPPPDLVLRPADVPQRLTPLDRRCEMLHQAGADVVVIARSTRQLLSLDPQEFIDKVLMRVFAPTHVVEGTNFRFGHGRAGNVQTLRSAGEVIGFGVHEVEPLMIELPGEGKMRVSSTLVRSLVATGQVALARRCLGKPYVLFGSVIRGEGRGRKLKFPTANLSQCEQIIPADGVYAAKAQVGDESFAAAVSIGTKPTFGLAPRAIEAFLIDASGDFYRRQMTLHMLERLRGQVKFANTDELKRQIANDVQKVREIYERL